MLKPPRLKPGDVIAIIAPSGPAPADAVDRAVAAMEGRGYKTRVLEGVRERLDGAGYLAGTDERRLADLHEALSAPGIAAVFCAVGGYGSLRLFASLRPELLARSPRIFAGYSDITALHLAFQQGAGVVTFHSPVACSIPRLDAPAADCFWRAIERAEPLPLPGQEEAGVETVAPGVAEGRLAGGNLSLMAHAVGSRFSPDFAGKIVLIEDVGERVYRADRYLTQLLNAGTLQRAAGFVVGRLTGWQAEEQKASTAPVECSPEWVWRDRLAPLGKPCIVNFPFGHERNPLTLPLGALARVDATACRLEMLESAVE